MTRDTKITALAVGLVAGLLLLLLVVAWPATAQPGVDSIVHLPIVTSPVVPTELYETDFDDSIAPWTAVRWQKGAAFDVDHEDGCDSGRCGFLDSSGECRDVCDCFAADRGPQRPYVIEFARPPARARGQAPVGAVFGGDWPGGACPGDNSGRLFQPLL